MQQVFGQLVSVNHQPFGGSHHYALVQTSHDTNPVLNRSSSLAKLAVPLAQSQPDIL